jgi:FkbM family methyltransferase
VSGQWDEWAAHIEINPGDTIVDVGANIGLFLLYLDQQMERRRLEHEMHQQLELGITNAAIREEDGEEGDEEGGEKGGLGRDSKKARTSPHALPSSWAVRVFAFEPLPPTFDVLKANVLRHRLHMRHLKPLCLARVGLGRSWEGAVEFTFYSNMCGNSTRRPVEKKQSHGSRGRSVGLSSSGSREQQSKEGEERDETLFGERHVQLHACPVATLSWAMREETLGIGSTVDLLKVDVEGCELAVLQGIRSADWPAVKQLVLEVHDVDGRLAEVVRTLKHRGFAVAATRSPGLEHLNNWNVYARRRPTPLPLMQ